MQTFKSIIKKLYTIILMGFVIWYARFITPVMFGHDTHREELLREMTEDPTTEAETAFRKFLKEQKETATVDIGTRVVDEQYVKGHFHHVGFHFQPDTTSVCVKCHGDVPHDKAKAIRAFLNMHAFYLGCETCHVTPKENHSEWVFRWYDKKTGEPAPNPPGLMVTSVESYGNYGSKIGPGIIEEGKFRFLNGEKERAFVDEYLKTKDQLSSTQQSRMKKIIHRLLDEQPLLCDSCHTSEKPYLPFDKLGYLGHRIADLTNTEVVGMISKYKSFYMPRFLLPGQTEIQLSPPIEGTGGVISGGAPPVSAP